MFSGRITHAIVRSLDFLAARILPADPRPLRHQLGAYGEEEAYFHLRRLGYQIVARNFRSSRCRGEIDLIGWDKNVLCFVEVKTRATRKVKPPEAAVDYHKRREMAEVAREYLRRVPRSCQWRFDVVSVYCESLTSRPQIEVFRGTSLAA
jgi:putative endonuclease